MTNRKTISTEAIECAGKIGLPLNDNPVLLDLTKLIRHSITLNKLYCCECNGCIREKGKTESWDQYDKSRNEVQIPWINRRITAEKRISQKLADKLGLTIRFNPDPRGFAIKIMAVNGNPTRGNTWGGDSEGYGIGICD